MTTQRHAFNDVLDLPNGAQWLKVDLHIHTPASSDFDSKHQNVTPLDVVNAALDKELDIIAITDHNTVGWCDKVRDAAKGTPLTVFPGVEVSTKEGHLLAVFDVDTTTNDMQEFLVSIGIRQDNWGDLDFASQKGIEEVADVVAEWKGVAIAAHADSNRGFLRAITNAQARHRAYSSQNLWAIEISDTTRRDQHETGTLYPVSRKMTCLQFSDSHKLKEDMAKRHTFLKMDERSINGLKLALLDPDIRVRFPEEQSPTPECTILGLWVTRGFLDKQKMRLNDGVNCLIGNTGAGKSLTIELIRFALDQAPVVEKIHQETHNLLANQLGNQGSIHVLLQKGETQYLIERTWENRPQPPFVQRINSDGSLHTIEIPTIQEFFPAKCFSQSEIIEFARNQSARLSLLDDLIEISEELTTISETKNKLKENAANILSTKLERDSLLEQISERTTLTEELARIDQMLPQSRIDEQQLWYKDQRILAKTKEQIDNLPETIDQIAAQLALPLLSLHQPDELPNTDAMNKLVSIFQTWRSHVTSAQNILHEKFNELTNSYNEIYQDWLPNFDANESELKSSLERIDVEGLGLTAQANRRRTLQENIDTLNQKEQELTHSVMTRLKNLKEDRESLLNTLQENRISITERRKSKAKELSNQLDHQIRIRIHARQERECYQNKLKSISVGARLPESECANLTKCNPIPFVKNLIARDYQTLSKETEVSIHRLERLWDTINERDRMLKLYELQLTDLGDTIEVQLEVQGKYKDLEELSHGQKCMVVLLIAQAEGTIPLLVDQPEDALHAPSIEEGIVKTLRSQRNSRQCIFATRNANILVSADSDQIIALESDANHGHVRSTGSLDSYNHRKLVVYHVEGGVEAFRRRKTLYDLKHSVEEG